jgi:hypothetical protein
VAEEDREVHVENLSHEAAEQRVRAREERREDEEHGQRDQEPSGEGEDDTRGRSQPHARPVDVVDNEHGRPQRAVGDAAARPHEVAAERCRLVLAAPCAGEERQQQRQEEKVEDLQHGRVAPDEAHGGRNGRERVADRSGTRSGAKIGLLPDDHRDQHGGHRGRIQPPGQHAQRQVGQCADQQAEGQQPESGVSFGHDPPSRRRGAHRRVGAGGGEGVRESSAGRDQWLTRPKRTFFPVEMRGRRSTYL